MANSNAITAVRSSRTLQRVGPGSLRWLTTLASTYNVVLTAFAVHLLLVFASTAVAVNWFESREAIPTVHDYEVAPMGGIWQYTLQPLSYWDGFWYISIADLSYEATTWVTAFWPLYPFLLYLGQQVTGWSFPLVGVVISNVALLIALGVFYRLAVLDYGELIAHRAIWLIALFPTAFYFSAVYSESLFLLLSVTAVYLARTERWTGAALAAVATALTRNTGGLILLPLGLLLLQQHGWAPRNWWRQAIQLGTAALSPLVYLFHLDRIWGNPLITVEVQEGWARYRAWPWDTLITAMEEADFSWYWLFREGLTWGELTSASTTGVRSIFAESGSYNLFVFFLFVLLGAYMLIRVRPAYSVYAMIAFILPLFSPSEVHPLMSIPRFAVVLFPFFLALAILLRNRWLFAATLVIFVVQFIAQLIQFSNWLWVA